MDQTYTPVHIEQDRRHWYFRGRLTVLLHVLSRVLPERPCRIVEIGCGTGNVLQSLERFGQVVGIERDPEFRAIARAAGLDVRDGALPDDVPIADGWADAILLLDVIEHVHNDVACLRAARRALRAGGVVVVTVPAYRWMWGAHDELVGHRRRYTARALRRALAQAGCDVGHVSYFNTVLFPAIASVRVGKRLAGVGGHDLYRPPEPVNRALAGLLGFERHFVLRPGLPFGTSVLVVARG